MINKHEDISVGVSWDEVDVPGCRLSGCSNERATMSSKNCKSTVEVHSVRHGICVTTETGGQIQAVVHYSVRLRKRDSKRARDLRRDA
jgi:hypothetical protein